MLRAIPAHTMQYHNNRRQQTTPMFSGYSQRSQLTLPDGKSRTLIHVTSFLRDLDLYLALPQILNRYTPHGAHISSLGCSEGSEVYSIIITLLSALGKKDATPYLPVTGIDLSPKLIARARSGYIGLCKLEQDYLKTFQEQFALTTLPELTPLGNTPPPEIKETIANQHETHWDYFKVSEEVQQASHFIQGNIVDYTESLLTAKTQPVKPTILFLRNVYYLLPMPEREQLLYKLKQLPENSLLFIGDVEMKRAKHQYKGNFFDLALPYMLGVIGFTPLGTHDPENMIFIKTKPTGAYVS